MRQLTNSISADGQVRRETKNGVDYLVFPSVIAKEGVMSYPEFGRDEYLPAESLEQTVDRWADMPITVNHPPDRGEGRTAKIPESYTSEVIGRTFNPELVGGDRVKVENWVDIERANSFGDPYAHMVDLLESDDAEQIGVSAGYGVVSEESEQGTFKGNSYSVKQGAVDPNHVALVTPDRVPRMGPEDGVGAPRLNHVDMNSPDGSTEATESQNPALIDRARAFGAAFRESFGFEPDGADVTTNAEEPEEPEEPEESDEVESNSDESEEAEADDSDEADAESTDSTTEDSEDPEDSEDSDADGGEGSESDDSDNDLLNSMSDNDSEFNRDETIESLDSDEDVPFDATVLEEMTDEQIRTISPDAADGDEPPEGVDDGRKEEGVDEEDASAESDEETEAEVEGEDDESPDAEVETETETTESPDTPGDDATEPEVEMTVNELTERMNSLEEKLEETQQENEKLREKVDPDVLQAKQAREQLAEATETDADELAALPDETAINMAANLGDSQQAARANTMPSQQTQRPNMAGAPGPVSRTNTEDEDLPPAGREAYEKRQNGDS